MDTTRNSTQSEFLRNLVSSEVIISHEYFVLYAFKRIISLLEHELLRRAVADWSYEPEFMNPSTEKFHAVEFPGEPLVGILLVECMMALRTGRNPLRMRIYLPWNQVMLRGSPLMLTDGTGYHCP